MKTKTSKIFRKAHAKRLLEYRKHVRPEYRKRIKNGPPITLNEYKEFRGNSWEFYYLYPILTDEALVYAVQICLDICHIEKRIPPVSYKENLVDRLTPLLLERFIEKIEEKKKKKTIVDKIKNISIGGWF